MSKLGDTIQKRLENNIISKVLKEELGNLGNFSITENGKIIFVINPLKIRNNRSKIYKIDLLTNEELIEKIKLEYKKFNRDKVDIEYVMQNSYYNKLVFIDSNVDITIDNCDFSKGVIIVNAKSVNLNSRQKGKKSLISSIGVLDISADKINLDNVFLTFNNESNDDYSTIELKSDDIIIQNTTMRSSKALNIDASNLKIHENNLWFNKIQINSPAINEYNNHIKGVNEFVINGKIIKPENGKKYSSNLITKLNNIKEELKNIPNDEYTKSNKKK